MAGNHFRLKNIGQIADANVNFGDLTVLVGPQATGKSIFLQLFKLARDAGYITSLLHTAGLEWEKDFGRLLYLYLGEGMDKAWSPSASEVILDEKRLDVRELSLLSADAQETINYIPAQRVMTLQNGWPRRFSDYLVGDPFVMRSFSQNLLRYMNAIEFERSSSEVSWDYSLLPNDRKMEPVVREMINSTILNGAELLLDKAGFQKKLMLKIGEGKLPYMVWSAGQREFIPLLLGALQLLPANESEKVKNVEYVIIEEPESGLHPRAIYGVMVLVLEMFYRGYKVILSTHSSTVLDVIWAIQEIKSQPHYSPEYLLELLGKPDDAGLKRKAKKILEKDFKVYYFHWDDAHVRSKEISKLDPGSEDIEESGWGGLTEFSGRAADVVGKVYRQGLMERQA